MSLSPLFLLLSLELKPKMVSYCHLDCNSIIRIVFRTGKSVCFGSISDRNHHQVIPYHILIGINRSRTLLQAFVSEFVSVSNFSSGFQFSRLESLGDSDRNMFRIGSCRTGISISYFSDRNNHQFRIYFGLKSSVCFVSNLLRIEIIIG